MIEPPAGWQKGAANSTPASSSSLTSVSIGPAVAPATSVTLSATAFDQIATPSDTPTVASTRNTPPPLPLPPPLPVAVAKTPPALPAAAVVSPMIEVPHSHRDVWLISGAVAAGVAISLALWVVMSMGGSSADTIATNKPATAPAPETKAKASAEQEPIVSESPPDTTETPTETTATPSVPTEDVTEVETRKPVVDEPTESTEQEIADAPSVEETPTEPVSPDPAPATEPVAAAPTEDNVAPGPAPADADDEEPAPASEPVAEIPPTGPLPNELLGKLARRVPRMAFKNVPLRQFAAFVGEYSDVRVRIDSESLKAAGIESPRITVTGKDVDLDKLLKEELEKSGLSFEPRDGAIVIFAPR